MKLSVFSIVTLLVLQNVNINIVTGSVTGFKGLQYIPVIGERLNHLSCNLVSVGRLISHYFPEVIGASFLTYMSDQ